MAYLTSTSDLNGNTITLTLNPSVPGQITQITDPTGRSLTLNYDSSNRVTSVLDPIGRMVQYTYNSQGTLASVTDPAGGVTAYAYNLQNNLTQIQDARHLVIAQFAYDGTGRVSQYTQADGGAITFAYTLATFDVNQSAVVQNVVKDALGNQTTYRFDLIGNVLDVTDPLGQRRVFTRDPTKSYLVTAITGKGSCKTCGDPRVGDQVFTLDANGNVLTQTDTLGNMTSFTYDLRFNKIASITDPMGHVISFTYDAARNVLTSTNGNRDTTNLNYNAFGQVTEVADPVGGTTSFTYDPFGNLGSTTDPLHNTTAELYDAVSRVVQITDPLGRRTSTTYDALDRIVSLIDAQNNSTQFTYDGVGNLLSVTDARGNPRSFTYDGSSRLLSETDALNHTASRTYDLDGDLATFTDRRRATSSFSYDALNRLVRETYADGGGVQRVYDANSRLISVVDFEPVGVLVGHLYNFAYDASGRLLNSVSELGTVQFGYNAASRVTSRQVVGQAILTYAYDAANRLITASLPGASANLAYDPRNLLTGITRGNGISCQYAYDAAERLLSITASGSQMPNSQQYSYDVAAERATQATTTAQPLLTQPITNTYDKGNRLITSSAGSGPGTFTYDANGNLLSQSDSSGTTTYTWDARNRLQSVVASGQTMIFGYDFAGRLISQNDSGLLNDFKTFLLDDLTNVAYVSQSNGDNLLVLAGRAIDQHLGVVHSNGQVEYGLADAINSTVVTTDRSGAVQGQFLYEPFGVTTVSGSTYPFQFTGRMPVSASLYYYRARFYNANTGRFISEDPLRVDTNLYRYALNRPTFLADPTGLQAGSGDFNVTPSRPNAVNGYYQSAVPTAPGYFPYGDYYNQQLISWATNKIIGDLLAELPAGGLLEKLFGNLTPYEYILPPAPSLSGVACSIGPRTPTIIRGVNPYQFQVNDSNGTFNGSFIP